MEGFWSSEKGEGIIIFDSRETSLVVAFIMGRKALATASEKGPLGHFREKISPDVRNLSLSGESAAERKGKNPRGKGKIF